MDREKLIEICETLLVSCKEQYCAACCLARLDYPRCRATYMADRIIEALEGEKNDRA